MTIRSAVAASILALAISTTPLVAARPSVPQPTDIAPALRSAGVNVENLQAFEIGGVVVIRGQSRNTASAEQAGRVAQSLGYTRVANLVQVIEAPDNEALARRAERELTIQRGLDGCTFRVQAENGIVYVAGHVQHELQKDMAIAVLRNMDGVREVRSQLQRQ